MAGCIGDAAMRMNEVILLIFTVNLPLFAALANGITAFVRLRWRLREEGVVWEWPAQGSGVCVCVCFFSSDVMKKT